MREALSAAEWLITEDGFDPERANVWETLCTVGNGYLGTRGTLEEGHPGDLSGTYLAGVYDSHDSPVIDLVNAPDWLSLAVYVDGARLDVRNASVLDHERTLDLRTGLLYRRTVFEDADGRRTRLETLRCASVADRRTCALRVEITPENHDGEITVESALDGRRRNLERLPVYPAGHVFPVDARWEKWARTRHLARTARAADGDVMYLETRTIASGITLGYAATTVPSVAPTRSGFRLEDGQVVWHAVFPGGPVRLDKLVRIGTSRDADGTDGGADSVREGCLDGLEAARGAGFDAIVAASAAQWEERWEDCDCTIDGDPDCTQALRFGIYHLLIAANDADPTVNIGAKSLSGEGYRGHVFWDTEILMLPFFVFTRPDAARSLLAYRHHTLPGARENARINGAAGARYPWESADTGREECPEFTPDGVNRFWTREEEVHINADVAHGVMQYVEATGDRAFLLERGAEILFETSRFWADRVDWTESGTCSLRRVMGPDEFHSHVDDNAFTNYLVRWHLETAADVHDELRTENPDVAAALDAALGLTDAEVDRWRAVAAAIALPPQRPDRLIEQFAGYFDRLDVPVTEWDENNMPRYPAGYHHFNCEDTQLLKQPDVLMALYMLPDVFDAADEARQLRVLRGAHAAQVVAQPVHPRDHGDRGRRPVARRAVLRALGVRRPHRQPGQHRRRHAHRLGGRHLAGARVRVRRLPGGARADVVPAVAARELAGDPLPAAVAGRPAARHGRPRGDHLRRRRPRGQHPAGAGARPPRRAEDGHHHGAVRAGGRSA